MARYAQRTALRRMMGRLPVQGVRRGLLKKPPKLKSFRLTGLRKVMPRMFRRGYGLGVFRKKRYNRRRIGYRRKTKNKVHTFVRWCDKDSLYPSSNGPSTIVETGVDQNLVYSFKLDNLTTPSDFTNLYDAYKINKITMYLEPRENATLPSNVVPSNKKICVVWDDDGNALTSEDEYLEYSNCRRYNTIARRTIKLTLYPKVSTPILNKDGALTAFNSVPANRSWIKIEDDEIPHFGFKIFVPAGVNIIGDGIFNVRVKYHLSMKNSK